MKGDILKSMYTAIHISMADNGTIKVLKIIYTDNI